MNHFLFTNVFGLLLFLSPVARSQVPAVDRIAEKEIESGNIVGMTIGVARDREIVHLKGYGIADIENSVPATEKTVYRIGSITKMFTAVAILQLLEEEKLQLDDPLTRYLPDYPDPENQITIRHLLGHTSGIANVTDLPGFRENRKRDLKPKDLPDLFQKEPVHFAPGEKFRYCNSGYLLLGIIIESLSGKSYREFLDENILTPLKMETTVYDRHVRIIPHRARSYSMWGKKIVNAPYVSMSQPYAAGALASTAGDMLKWMPGIAEGKVITVESFRLMTSPGRLNDESKTRYGLGCFVEKLNGRTVIRHGGGIAGFVSEIVYQPDSKISVVVLTNTGKNLARPIANKVMTAVLPAK